MAIGRVVRSQMVGSKGSSVRNVVAIRSINCEGIEALIAIVDRVSRLDEGEGQK